MYAIFSCLPCTIFSSKCTQWSCILTGQLVREPVLVLVVLCLGLSVTGLMQRIHFLQNLRDTHTPHTVYLTPHTYTVWETTHTLPEYLELFLKTSSAYFSLCIQLVEGDPEVGCRHLCVPTHHQLSQGIMNKNVLSLERDSLLMHALCGAQCLAHLCLHHHYALASHAPKELVHTEAAL